MHKFGIYFLAALVLVVALFSVYKACERQCTSTSIPQIVSSQQGLLLDKLSQYLESIDITTLRVAFLNEKTASELPSDLTLSDALTEANNIIDNLPISIILGYPVYWNVSWNNNDYNRAKMRQMISILEISTKIYVQLKDGDSSMCQLKRMCDTIAKMNACDGVAFLYKLQATEQYISLAKVVYPILSVDQKIRLQQQLSDLKGEIKSSWEYYVFSVYNEFLCTHIVLDENSSDKDSLLRAVFLKELRDQVRDPQEILDHDGILKEKNSQYARLSELSGCNYVDAVAAKVLFHCHAIHSIEILSAIDDLMQSIANEL